jgi:hypothetical protein
MINLKGHEMKCCWRVLRYYLVANRAEKNIFSSGLKFEPAPPPKYKTGRTDV